MMHRDEALANLRRVSETERPRDMRRAFAQDPDRPRRYTATLDDLTLDYSKCAVSEPVVAALLDLAAAAGVASRREAMFRGERINITEDRAALHVALRSPGGDPPWGAGIAGEVADTLARLGEFADGVRAGRIRGAGGHAFRAVVNIGIGGSDLGPAMATEALAHVHDGPELHFVSNVDAAAIAAVLKRLEP